MSARGKVGAKTAKGTQARDNEGGIVLALDDAAMQGLQAAADAWGTTVEAAAGDILSQAAECGSVYARAGLDMPMDVAKGVQHAGKGKGGVHAVSVEAAPLVMEVLQFRAVHCRSTIGQDAGMLVCEWLEGAALLAVWRGEYERAKGKRGKAAAEMAEMARDEVERIEELRKLHLVDFARFFMYREDVGVCSYAETLKKVAHKAVMDICERLAYGDMQGKMITFDSIRRMSWDAIFESRDTIMQEFAKAVQDACIEAVSMASLAGCAEPLPLAGFENTCVKEYGKHKSLYMIRRNMSGRAERKEVFP